jgi:hypothetical protein
MPSDLLLMGVRMGVVACVAAALAGPILITDARLAAWNGRVARAVVVDTSDSMRAGAATADAVAPAAGRAADAERRTAAFSARFDVTRLEDGIVRASRWLAGQPASRREIVIVSDFQIPALDGSALDELTPELGLRFVVVGKPRTGADIAGQPLFGGPGIARTQRVGTTTDTTAVVVDAAGAAGVRGLRVLGPPQSEASVARLLRAVASAGAYAGNASEPIAVRLAGAPPDAPASVTPVKAGWMLQAVLRMREADMLIAAAEAVLLPRPVFDPIAEPWGALLRDANGATLVRAAASGEELIIDVAATPDDIFAAAVVQAALVARVDPESYDEQEIRSIASPALATMERTAGPVTREAWRDAETTDARWCWLAAVALLAVEQRLRSRGSRASSREGTRVAA